MGAVAGVGLPSLYGVAIGHSAGGLSMWALRGIGYGSILALISMGLDARTAAATIEGPSSVVEPMQVPPSASGSVPPADTVEISATALAALPEWRLAPEPEVTIGLIDGPPEYLFGTIRSAVFLPDGGVAVADGQAREIRVFDREGKFVRSMGRPGEGPGEFVELRQVELLGDTALAAWDDGPKRLKLFRLDGTFLDEWRSGACIGTTYSSGFTSYPAACRSEPAGIPSADAVVFPSELGGPPFGRMRRDGEEMRIIADRWGDVLLAGPEGARVIDRIHAQTYVGIRNSIDEDGVDVFRFAAWYDGLPWIAARAGWIVYGNSEHPELRILRFDGAASRLLRIGWTPEPVGERHLNFVRQTYSERLNALGSRSLRARMRVLERSIEASKPFGLVPFYDGLLIDRVGRIWLGAYIARAGSEHESPRPWIAIGLDGTPLARMTFPGGIGAWVVGTPIHDISEDRVLVVARDEDTDVARLEIYRIIKR